MWPVGSFICGACALRQEKTSSWAECIIEECSQEGCRRMENWVFRKEHAEDYQAGDACEAIGSPCYCMSLHCQEGNCRELCVSLDHFIREACVSSSVGVCSCSARGFVCTLSPVR